ncbi:FRG domain-containing protein [Acinetobacter johnsonii]|uniref:FRG domain-containing protein n=1 Tax=Acinetobacter johnsonii TaxID=40214 RepID=UPI001F327E36|nr:FRG domain-containing protein [Acinetobacter johnsonii]UJA03475.1 FRG domain-containing protein [Acinetobacter johnsonii]
MFDLNKYVISDKNGYLETNINNIDDLIELIRPDKNNCIQLMRKANPLNEEIDLDEHCIFRGQADSAWKLTPSLFRLNSEKIFSKFLSFEKTLINTFEYYCDNSEISIPGDSLQRRKQRLDTYLRSVSDDSGFKFDENDFELLAFAQHYGVPTRLLDWSYQPLVSLYFAAIEAVRLIDLKVDTSETLLKKSFSLWVVSAEQLLSCENIELLEVPASNNNHLSRQAGCFTVVKEFQTPPNFMNYSPKTLEQVLQENNLSRILLKINVDLRVAARAVYYCSSYGFDGAKLFGGANGAARSCNDWLLFQKIAALK